MPAKGTTNNPEGRKKGVPNKQTTAVKQCIINAFQDIGGVRNLVKWARENETDFYTKMYIKVMPTEVTGTDGGDIQITLKKVVHSARDNDQ